MMIAAINKTVSIPALAILNQYLFDIDKHNGLNKKVI
jgi:hypothetical protein